MEVEQLKTKNLAEENKLLLEELETAYKNMTIILEQSKAEMDIAYKELDERYQALENLYSQLSKKENMLIHMEKLSSIGQFITEIIHELNNPLTVISGMTDLVLMDPALPKEMAAKLNKIPKQVTLMTNYLSRFKSMAYKGKEDFTCFNLNESLEEFIATIAIIRPKSITIQSELCSDKLFVNGDKYQLMQIYLNLAKNAFDAMESKGKSFTISSQYVTKNWVIEENNMSSISSISDQKWNKILKENNEFAFLEFKDDGSGIPKDIITNIFDAFFTTKGRGKGTGLGLSIATDITERHNASLGIKSIMNEGTTFQFIIPLVK
jgi:signal transduction histidine kinase